MAEIIATELIKVVFQKLADEGFKRYVRSKGIHSEIKNLGKTLSKIQDLLKDASEKEISDKAVKRWLNSLHHLAYDIDDVLDSLATDAMHRKLTEDSGATTSKVTKFIPTCCGNFSLSNRLSQELDSIAAKLQDLEKEKLGLGLTKKHDKPKSTSRKNETCLPDSSRIVGRDSDKKKLICKLLADEPCKEKFSVVPIVGMGGIGKTTLARFLYNDAEVKGHFKLHVWVCVSDDFDVFKISENIFQELTGENKRFNSLNQVQIALSEQLKENRFLLVLDDVWSVKYADWENLVKPFQSGASGSKIIMTTRKEGLLKQLHFDHLDKLESLSHDDAMSLLAQHALDEENFDSHMKLKQYGDGIVKNCGGLPLALKAIGRLLSAKTNEQDWECVLDNEIWRLKTDDEIVPALRLSYQELSACSKQLFAYCSLFPKDFVFHKEQLVLLWIAEGFFDQSVGSNSTDELLGHEYFEDLLSRSFFQRVPDGESLFVMHDLMNDLATFVAGDFCLRFDNQMDMKREALEKYRHMPFISEEYVAYQKFEAIKGAKSLRTFLAVSDVVKEWWKTFYLSSNVLVDLLPQLPLLRVLSLSGFEISEVPEFIGSLKHLRYLNLSQTQIVELPENVGNLYNLQTLIVFGCHKLHKFPMSLLKLKNLHHLDMSDTPLLKHMPLGVGELKSLHTLTKIIIEGDDGFAIAELKELKNLQGKVSIEGLHKVKKEMHARDANLSLKRLTELELLWGRDDPSEETLDSSKVTLETKVLKELKPPNDTLKQLKIVSYSGIEFPIWLGDPSFRQLVHLSIRGCKKCKSLPALGGLPSLKELFIQGMNEIDIIGCEFLGTGNVAFPSLEILCFEDMSGWAEWSTQNSGVVDSVFPCLRELSISKCPKLVDISLEALPSLRSLEVSGCGDGVLRSIIRASSSITELIIKYISGLTDEVWKGVIKYLGGVEEIRVVGCNEIRYMWDSEAQASTVFVNLKGLEVDGCGNLLRLGEKEEDDYNCKSNFLTSFRMLTVIDCESMKCCCCPNSIETLRIGWCSSMTHVSFPTGGVRKLKSLEIYDCKELLVAKELGGENKNCTISSNISIMPLVELVRIVKWLNVKSINELCYSVHLTYLMIENCYSIESVPDLVLRNLTSLEMLDITNCPNMDVPGYWPPKLNTLHIGNLKKPVSEWGHQKFPDSLVNLMLLGKGGQENSISQLSDLLPPSLTTLRIRHFEEMKSISTGLQHLTSLTHLKILFCPNIIDLPEMLLPSLLSLTIYECPKLIERSTRGKGSYYWPKISHIPRIDLMEY